MKLLLDTHALIWWHEDNAKLSRAAFEAIRDPDNAVFLSVVNAWEMQIKTQLGKLSVANSVPDVIRSEIEGNGFRVLPVTLDYVYDLDARPFHHKDPFDRLLIAQARHEGLTLVSSDKPIRAYDVKTLW